MVSRKKRGYFCTPYFEELRRDKGVKGRSSDQGDYVKALCLGSVKNEV